MKELTGIIVSFSEPPDYYVNSFNRRHIKEATGLNNKKFRSHKGKATIKNRNYTVEIHEDGRPPVITVHEQKEVR